MNELLTAREAMETLGVSHTTFARLLKDGLLHWETSPLDRREKLLRRADVEALLKKAGRAVEAQN